MKQLVERTLTEIREPRIRETTATGQPPGTTGLLWPLRSLVFDLGCYVPYLMAMHPLTTALTDLAIVSRIPETTPMTPDRLCELYAARVYRFATMVARGGIEAEDIAQEALERAIRGFGRYDPGRGPIDGWLWRIVTRAAIDAGRADMRRTRILSRLVAWRGVPDDVAEPFDDSLTDEALLEAIRALTPRDRTMVALRFGGDLTYAAIGALLGISEAAVGVAMRRALARLRGELTRTEGRQDEQNA